MVSSWVTITLRALPATSVSTLSKLIAWSSLTTVPPVNVAMSCKISLRRSPKAGALTATTLSTPLSLLSISVPSTSPSISSAIISRSFLPACANCSSTGRNSCIELIFLSVIKIDGFSSTASMRAASLTIYGLTKPRSKVKPSTTSDSSSRLWPSSTVTTPSLPTLSITVAIRLPISASAAEIVATSATRFLLALISSRIPSRRLRTSCVAASKPLRNSIGL